MAFFKTYIDFKKSILFLWNAKEHEGLLVSKLCAGSVFSLGESWVGSALPLYRSGCPDFRWNSLLSSSALKIEKAFLLV